MFGLHSQLHLRWAGQVHPGGLTSSRMGSQEAPKKPEPQRQQGQRTL